MDSGLKLDCILNFSLKKGLDYSLLFLELKNWLEVYDFSRIFLLSSEEIDPTFFIKISNFSELPDDVSTDVILISNFFDFNLDYLFSFHKKNDANITIPLKIDYENGHYLLDNDFRLKINSVGEGFSPVGCFIIKSKFLNNIENFISSSNKTYGIPIPEQIVDFNGLHFQFELDHAVNRISEIKKKNQLKVVFLDRDGIINEDLGYVYKIEDLKFKDGLFEFMDSLQKYFDGFIITTNQAGIAKGKFTEEDYFEFQDYLERELIKREFKILGSFYCPFHKDGIIEKYRKKSLDRKPEPGMFLKAAERFNIDLTKSIMIGDKESDIIKLPYLKSYILKGNYEINDSIPVYKSFEEILEAITNEKIF